MDPNPFAYVIPVICALAHAAFLVSRYDAFVVQHELVSDEPLWVAAALPALYLVAVYAGSKWMGGARAAYEPKAAIFVYNVYETLLSTGMLVLLLSETVGKGVNIFAAPVDHGPRGALLAYAMWINYQSKFVEYFDTAFMIARKKFNQVTLLHVSHHVVMGPVMYLMITQAPGGCAAFGPAINSGIHSLMYSYYLITALGFRPAWKQLLTAAQLAQFVAILAHSVYHLANPYGGPRAFPLVVACVEFALMIQMLVMFGDFFVSSYGKGGKGGGKQREAKAAGRDD